jgi:hypothetical protein
MKLHIVDFDRTLKPSTKIKRPLKKDLKYFITNIIGRYYYKYTKDKVIVLCDRPTT